MKPVFYMLFSLLLFSSCEKVIDVDLNETNPQIVIEAQLYEGEQEFVVKVSKTSSYFDAEEITRLNDATVTLTGPENETVLLSPQGNGQYAAIVNASGGALYTLEVSHDLGVYSATTFLHTATPIVELSFEETNIRSPFGLEEDPQEPRYFVSTAFKDVAGIDNYYRFNVTVNGQVVNPARGGYFMTDDGGQDGNVLDYALLGAFLYEGDEIDLQLWSIDQATYQFYETFSSGGEGMNNASPANPSNNWSNGALGYFAGIAVDQKSIVILP